MSWNPGGDDENRDELRVGRFAHRLMTRFSRLPILSSDKRLGTYLGIS
jgi:hypothetical protein